jgi:hypothetical protein
MKHVSRLALKLYENTVPPALPSLEWSPLDHRRGASARNGATIVACPGFPLAIQLIDF